MDKQLGNITHRSVQLKIKHGQGLNAKEFAVATGFNYAAARALFNGDDFPVFNGRLFWADWEVYRRRKNGLARRTKEPAVQTAPTIVNSPQPPSHRPLANLSPRAARLLAQVG